MGQTPIEWSDYTFNGLWGCEKISPGCKNCYAMTFDKRVGGDHWGPGKPRREFGDDYWEQPHKWQTKAVKDSRIYRVFCSSMADWLEDHPQWVEPRRRLEALVAATPNLIWLFLTKRPENWRLMPESWQDRWPSNAMFGFTGENQEWFERRRYAWLELSRNMANLRTFLSIEPMLGQINLGGRSVGRYINWVICGGESGHGARPMHPDWARSLRDQCAAAGVPFLFKQWGEWEGVEEVKDGIDRVFETHIRKLPVAKNHCFVSRSGHVVRTEDEMVEEVCYRWMKKVGKKAAGRLLDGVEHNGLPAYWPSNVGLIESDPLKVIA